MWQYIKELFRETPMTVDSLDYPTYYNPKDKVGDNSRGGCYIISCLVVVDNGKIANVLIPNRELKKAMAEKKKQDEVDPYGLDTE